MTLSIRPVTADNWRAIAELAPHPSQEAFIEANAFSMLEAVYDDEHDWQCYGLYTDDTPAGFIMIGAKSSDGSYIWLDRFMIDHRFQGRGLGGAFLHEAIRFIRDKHRVNEIVLSVIPENKPAKTFYEKNGFVDLKRVNPEDGEEMFVYDLK
ncbi:GNAT family N-acetyltransferase [Alkalicoccus luteus]|uniref:GNAT family N-acetyltransferase n=1 Tax=Alkalicoccus luteus TaxID=1237094 RepID=UPI0040342B8C